MSRYHDVYAAWKKDPEAFWGEAAREIDWFKPWDKVFDPEAGQYGRWFTGAECNTAYNCLDRHVERGRGQQNALIYDSPVTNQTKSYTYEQLTHEVSTFGAVLQDLGVKKGDRVIIYMPMVPEAVIAMLACARIGAIHSVVFGGFAAHELATRLDDCTPTAIVSAS
ncbi:MAG: AMP-binding protein, partial [Hyphomicrobiaceae bacterium]